MLIVLILLFVFFRSDNYFLINTLGNVRRLNKQLRWKKIVLHQKVIKIIISLGKEVKVESNTRKKQQK